MKDDREYLLEGIDERIQSRSELALRQRVVQAGIRREQVVMAICNHACEFKHHQIPDNRYTVSDELNLQMRRFGEEVVDEVAESVHGPDARTIRAIVVRWEQAVGARQGGLPQHGQPGG